MKEVTTDTALNGHIRVKQHRHGYRFSIDALLLAGFVKPVPAAPVLDLGTGCGIIPLILAWRYPGLQLYGVEVQEELAFLAEENVAENHMCDRIKILHMDLKKLEIRHLPDPIGLIVSNPPFRRHLSGRINPDPQRAIARHELKMTLDDLVSVSGRILARGGKFAGIYPSERLVDLLVCMRDNRIEPKSLRMVHSEVNTEAKRVLVEGVKEGRSDLRVRRPLFIYQPDGSYTPEVEEMFLP